MLDNPLHNQISCQEATTVNDLENTFLLRYLIKLHKVKFDSELPTYTLPFSVCYTCEHKRVAWLSGNKICILFLTYFVWIITILKNRGEYTNNDFIGNRVASDTESLITLWYMYSVTTEMVLQGLKYPLMCVRAIWTL